MARVQKKSVNKTNLEVLFFCYDLREIRIFIELRHSNPHYVYSLLAIPQANRP